MNARNPCINIRLEERQIKDALSCIIDSTLLHRVVGKYNYDGRGNRSFTMGSLGLEEVTCDSIDLTYIRVNSRELVADVEQKVQEYVNHINQLKDGCRYGSPSYDQTANSLELIQPFLSTKLELEFYKIKRKQWPATDENLPWEIWTIGLELIRTDRPNDFERMKEDVGEQLGEKVMFICNLVNQPKSYVPNNPTHSELQTIFNTNISDAQPYLYRLRYKNDQPTESLTSNIRNFLKQAVF